MLCQFSVKNYKSIREEVTLDMQAAAISEHEDRIIADKDGEKFLPLSVLYGPNGAGKSNVLEALANLVLFVAIPIIALRPSANILFPKNRVVFEPFAFSDAKNAPTEFEIFYRTSAAEYRYELSVLRDEVLYERLDRIKFDTKRRAMLFERDGENIEMGADLSKLKVSKELSKTISLLSYLGITFKENEVVNDSVTYFEKGFCLLNYGNSMSEMNMDILGVDRYKELVLELLSEMDMDIVDYRVEEKDNHTLDIYTKHCVGGEYTELKLEDESSGTQKLFSMFPLLVIGLLRGNTFVIDELDAKLHPLLLKHIIMMFNDLSINKNKAQLLFTSHDLSTMNSEVFRRDEIWFVAKGNEQNSQLYSLVDFKDEEGKSVRKDAKFDKQYLEGKYGADPYLKRIIDWSAQNA